MGFYSPHSLVQDARRHGVPTLSPDVNASGSVAALEWCPQRSRALPVTIAGAADIVTERRDAGWAVRLGLRSVRHLGDDLADRIAQGRPYTSIEDLARRSGADRPVLEALASAGAFGCFESTRDGSPLDRRRSLWTAGAVAGSGADHLDGIVTGVDAPTLPVMSAHDEAMADLWATGVSPEGHPTRFLRDHLASLGVVTAEDLPTVESGSRVLVGGVVTHRQRPATAEGVTFVNLEDETGLINVVVSVGCWARYRRAARGAPALLVRGRLERAEGVVNVVADKLEPLPVGPVPASRDFR
jgi:error-prone DNA polymerase